MKKENKKFSSFLKEKENIFYLIIVLTIATVRLSKFFFLQNVHLRIAGIVIHHFWIGILLLSTGFFIPKNKKIAKILLYGIGMGLIIDESMFMVFGGGLDMEYWKLQSVIGAAIVAICIYPLRKKLEKFLFKINLSD